MNILFLSLIDFGSFEDRNIYSDLLREFRKNGHRVFCISPVEKRTKQEERVISFGDDQILKLKIGNTQKVNLLEKGISILRIESLFIRGIKKYFADVKFDLVLYATPPVTFAKVIRFVKKRDGARSYLMLKDIFPQNSVDLQMLKMSGPRGLIYRYFRRKEKILYAISDRIGCMSQANVEYVLKHNPTVATEKVEICPNSIEIRNVRLTKPQRDQMRDKYGIPREKKVFVYGGNFGKPQDVPFVVNCLQACIDVENVFFVIAGSGTDRHLLEAYMEREKPGHVKLFDEIPREEYDAMIACCDVGLIFLDHRFTIPNFPSRLLSYMQAGLPVLACTDATTDIGKVIVEGGFGWWCESDSSEVFRSTIKEIIGTNTEEMAQKTEPYLCEQYSSEVTYRILERFMNGQ